MSYVAPIIEQTFVLRTVADLRGLSTLPRFAAMADEELTSTVLTHGAVLAEQAFEPLDRLGDREGASWLDGDVHLPRGFAEAYRDYVEGGWGSLSANLENGGQGLPFALSSAVMEQFGSANAAFSLCMILTGGAVEALQAHGNEEQRRIYLSKLVSGEWTGTMNLTEPQAGSDVGALRTLATPASDGTWRIKGSKIFITWGEHDLAENIVHLVLARTPGAPSGTKGISLFVVPKFLPDESGAPGERNDVRCASIEHKLGMHASPTCTMIFGDQDDCVGWLVGEEGSGMRAMFTMMNNARINVGLQGVSIAERAYQAALAYSRERVQSAAVAGGDPVRIVEHPDVRRMLMEMRALTQAGRALVYWNASLVDRAHGAIDVEQRADAKALADVLTPVTKAWATDIGVEVSNVAVQVFGGMGFIEETGISQRLRDARIAPIYEGTNGIQAIDLVSRKLTLLNGAPWRNLMGMVTDFADRLALDETFRNEAERLREAAVLVLAAADRLVGCERADALAVATPFTRMTGVLLGAYLLMLQAEAAARDKQSGDSDFRNAKIATARFFVFYLLPEIGGLARIVNRGRAANLFALSEEQLAR